MSDAPADPGAGDPSSAPPSPPASEPPVSAGGGDLDDLPADQALFPRSYVEKVRTEAQKYRTEAQQAKAAAERAARYDEVYGQYQEADQNAWLDLARTFATDPVTAAKWMDQVARNVLGEQGDTPDTPDEPEPDSSGLLTPEQVQQMIDQTMSAREQAAAQQREVDNVFKQIRDAGVTAEADVLWVLSTTNNETNGDIDAAVAQLRQRDQKVIDEYLAGRTGGTPRPTPGPNGGVAANQSTEISSFEDARKATDEFLRSQRAAGQ